MRSRVDLNENERQTEDGMTDSARSRGAFASKRPENKQYVSESLIYVFHYFNLSNFPVLGQE